MLSQTQTADKQPPPNKRVALGTEDDDARPLIAQLLAAILQAASSPVPTFTLLLECR